MSDQGFPQGLPPARKVTVLWSAFCGPEEEPAQLSGMFASALSDLDLCELLFRETNLYEGALWDLMEPHLPPARTHTALSVGDRVVIDDRVYRCEPVGWELQGTTRDW